MKTHGRTFPLTDDVASTSRESLDSSAAPAAYRYYPGPMANLNASQSSPETESGVQAESEAEPESEDDAMQAGATGVSSKSDGETKSEEMDHEPEAEAKSDGEGIDVDIKEPEPELVRGAHTPVLGRPRSVQVPLVFQTGVMPVGTGAFASPTRTRNTSETSGRSLGSPGGELHCPVSPMFLYGVDVGAHCGVDSMLRVERRLGGANICGDTLREFILLNDVSRLF